MIYFSDKELDDLLLEDIYRGDLTTRALGVEKVPAKIEFKRKNAGVVAGISVAERLLKKLDITPQIYVSEGEFVEAGAVLLSAVNSADKLQQAWKVVQLVLEWSCGVAQYTAEMIANAKTINRIRWWLVPVKVSRIPVNWRPMQCWLLADIFIVKA